MRVVLECIADLAGLRQAVRCHGAEWLGDDQVDVLALVTSEAATNGLVHGGAPVTVELEGAPDGVVVRVYDRGDGFDPGAVPLPGPAVSPLAVPVAFARLTRICSFVPPGLA